MMMLDYYGPVLITTVTLLMRGLCRKPERYISTEG